MKKILLVSIVLFFIGAGFWYFFYKEADYSISFYSSASSNLISRSLEKATFDEVSVENLSGSDLNEVLQTMTYGGEKRILNWKFSAATDSVTQVIVQVNDPEAPFMHRLRLIFGRDPFQKKLAEEIREFKQNLETASKLYDIQFAGKSTSPAARCACLALKSKVEEKAFEMMKNIDILSSFVLDHKLEMAGKPRVDIKKWNRETGTITFDFCFPIEEGKVFPEHPLVFQKQISSRPALKAIYRGNYMFSHEAWYFLANHAVKSKLQVETEPLEIFIDNPEVGGDGRNWKAEIYLPLN